jgi:hypothetical protein
MHQSSLDKMTAFRNEFLRGKELEPLKIVDLGSQDVNGTYRSIFEEGCWRYVGIDMEPGPNVDMVIRNPYAWREIATNSVDVFISGQTLEHIEYFWLTALEVTRVLKPLGLCCMIAPSSGFEHRYPLDCWRFFPDGFRALCKFAGLEALKVYTQWEDRGYQDGSDIWHDTVLVARKMKRRFFERVKWDLRQLLNRKLLDP